MAMRDQQELPERLAGESTQRPVQTVGPLGVVLDGGAEQQHADDAERDALGDVADPPSQAAVCRVPADIRAIIRRFSNERRAP
jgi:hypothetical protein